MPTYEYACESCGHHLEVFQSFSDEPLATCPSCGGPLRKVFGSIGIVLKGSGFYRTDSRAAGTGSKRKEPAAGAGASAESGGSSGSGGEPTSSKPSGSGKASTSAGPATRSSGDTKKAAASA